MDKINLKEKFSENSGPTRHSKKKILLPIILIIGIAAAIYYYFGIERGGMIGEVEATIYPNKTELSGKIAELPFSLGQEAKKGDTIAVLDSTGQQYEIEQLEIVIEKQKIALSESQLGADGSTQAERNLALAQAAYNSALARYNKAQNDYKNAMTLFQEGAISKDSLDMAKLQAENAREALTAASIQIQNVASGTASKTAELDLMQNESRLKQMKENLEKYTIKAAVDGTIISLNYVVGDTVAPGYNLADIAGKGEKYLVFYVPEEKVSTIDYGSEIDVSYHNKKYTGIVKYIDVKSQYTPKDLQTAANKNKESFKIKLLLPEDAPMKPGETAQVYMD